MNPQGVRINYGQFGIAAEPLYKNTIVGFDGDLEQHTYVLGGCFTHLKNTGILEGSTVQKGTHLPLRNIIRDSDGKILETRYIAVHENTLCVCFFSKTHNFDILFIKVNNEIVIEPYTQHIVIEGPLSIQEKVARQFDLIVERKNPVLVRGSGLICKIEYLGRK